MNPRFTLVQSFCLVYIIQFTAKFQFRLFHSHLNIYNYRNTTYTHFFPPLKKNKRLFFRHVFFKKKPPKGIKQPWQCRRAPQRRRACGTSCRALSTCYSRPFDDQQTRKKPRPRPRFSKVPSKTPERTCPTVWGFALTEPILSLR